MATWEEQYDAWRKSGAGQTVEQTYDAERDANLARMEEEYNRNRSQQEADAAKIPGMYREQANDLTSQTERQRRNFNTQAAANGINTGAASQAQLAQNAAYQKGYGQIGAAQANAETEAQRQLSDLEAAYRSQVNAAIADADYKKAQALMQAYNDDRNRQLSEAAARAQYGDFSGYAAVYGAQTAEQMRQVWIAQNPDLAYNTGNITAQQYYKMTGKWPPGTQPADTGYGGGSSKSKSKNNGKSGTGKSGTGKGSGSGQNSTTSGVDTSRENVRPGGSLTGDGAGTGTGRRANQGGGARRETK